MLVQEFKKVPHSAVGEETVSMKMKKEKMQVEEDD